MALVNTLCAEINIYQGVGEATGTIVERKALRGRKGLCRSFRDLASKARTLGDGYYYLPLDEWPANGEPVVLHRTDWTPLTSLRQRKVRTKRKTS